MRLARIRTENFRMGGTLDLHLDRTSVLFGETASGKSTVVDALAVALGFAAEPDGFAFAPTDLPTAAGRGEATRILLWFGEDEPGVEPPNLPANLAPAVHRDRKGRAGIRFEVRARHDAGADVTEVRWRFRDADKRTLVGTDRPEVLRALREAFPAIVIRGGLALGNESLRRSLAPLREQEAGALDDATREQVRDLYHRLLSSRGAFERDEVQALFERVRSYALERLVAPDAAPWLVSPGAPVADPRDGSAALAGSAQKIGTLLLTGAIIEARALGHGGLTGWPVLVVEDPEAHLHPTILSAVWALLDLLQVQKLVTTNSETLLAEVPLPIVRRLVRRGSHVRARGLHPRTLSAEELRKVSYHVRVRRGLALFARCWLLVEGETEAWLMPGLARQCGYDLGIEGVCCMEFAQCGVEPLVKLANDLGIRWHLLADGDEAGTSYAKHAQRHLAKGDVREHVTMLPDRDVEHHLWSAGYADVYRAAAWKDRRRAPPERTLKRAIQKRSKPYLVLEVLRAMEEAGPDGPPPLLRHVIQASVRLARKRMKKGRKEGRKRDHDQRNAPRP